MKDVAGGIGDKPIYKCPNCSGTDFYGEYCRIFCPQPYRKVYL